MHPDTPLHTSLPLNTAVALPISLSVLRRDLCFVFFAEHDVNVSAIDTIGDTLFPTGPVDCTLLSVSHGCRTFNPLDFTIKHTNAYT